MWPLPSLQASARGAGWGRARGLVHLLPAAEVLPEQGQNPMRKSGLHIQASSAHVKTLTLGCCWKISIKILLQILSSFQFCAIFVFLKIQVQVGISALIFGAKVLKAEGDLNTFICNSSIKKTVLLLSKYNYWHSSYISNLTWKCLRQHGLCLCQYYTATYSAKMCKDTAINFMNSILGMSVSVSSKSKQTWG